MIAALLAATETRSSSWVWVVVGGFAISLVLLYHVVSTAIGSLPDDIRDRLRGSLRSNGRPVAVTGVVLVWTMAFALYNMAIVPVSTVDEEPVAAGDGVTLDADDGSIVTGGDVTPAPGDTTPATDGSTGAAPATRGGAPAAPRPSYSALGNQGSGGPTQAASNVRDSNLYSGDANTVGITADTIKICGHAPLSLGAVLNTKPEDLLVFWKHLNEKGGIHGRKFEVSLTDDQYTAEGGVPAAQQCAEQNPFMIFGALGSDVIPPVRQWAEENKQLYLYGFTVRAGSEKFRYSFSGTISQEALSTVIANVANQRFAGTKVGILWRNSSNFQPGRDAFKRTIAAGGGEVVADIPVTKSQGNYTQEIIELRQSGAETVFVLDDAFSQTNIIKQAISQQYRPNWLVFSFNIQTQTIGADSLDPPLVGANLAPAYTNGVYDGPFASYAAEIKEFEAAYAKYSPNTDLKGIAGDIAWQGWVGFKAIAGLFEACGRECTRNRFAGVMEGGFKATIGAACPVDFSGDGHHGGHATDIMEAFLAPDGRAAWRNAARCQQA
jgi:branched-chain amino acid transport system substrate-binding protein